MGALKNNIYQVVMRFLWSTPDGTQTCCLDGFVLVSALLASLRLVCFVCVFCSLRFFVADERDLGLAMTHGP